MGQLLIVQGEDEREVQSLFQRGLLAFEKLVRLRPQQEFNSGSTAVAKFPKLLKPTSGIVQNSVGPGWVCGAGTWFYDGMAGETALAALLQVSATGERALQSRLEAVDGIFAVALGNPATDELSVITDRVGSLHIYRTRINSCLVLSTSSMVPAALSHPAWDLVSCREFLASGTIFFGQHTLFEGIEKLESATVFKYKNGCLQSQSKYWDPSAVMYDRVKVHGDVEHLASALEDCLAVLSRNFSRPMFDLTGGLDSRALLGAKLHVPGDFETVVNGQDTDPDVQIANRIAREFQLKHRNESPQVQSGGNWWRRAQEALPLCDGEYDLLLYARVLDVHSRLAADADASINGSYGELCGGYCWHLLFPFTGWKRRFNDGKVARARFGYDEELSDLMEYRFPESLGDHFSAVVRHANAGFEARPNTVQMDNHTLAVQVPRWQGRIASATCRLWPCVSPFLWRIPLEVALTTPASDRVRNRMKRRLIEHFSPRLARVPLTDGCPALPLRVNTAYLFLPATRLVSKKVKRIMQPHLAAFGLPVNKAPNPIRMLWEQREIQELLSPGNMATRTLYRPHGLERFLQSSKAEVFAGVRGFGRILTLELLAQALRGFPLDDGDGLHTQRQRLQGALSVRPGDS